MGRLYGARAYLVGPMDRVADHGVGWRKDLTPFLQSRGIVVLDPSDKKIEYGLENAENREYKEKLLANKDYDTLSLVIHQLRVVDLHMVDMADFLIVNFDIDVPMCGTYEEIFWANRLKRPILLMCPQGKAKIFTWLFGCLPHQQFYESWEEVKNYISAIDNAPLDKVKNESRWIFFNWKELLPE